MSLRAVDARFLLPSLPASARVFGDLPGWREGLHDAGVAVLEGGSAAAEVIVADAAHASVALASDAPAVVASGAAAGREARRRGWSVTEYLRLPRTHFPEFFVPADQPATLRYFFDLMRVAPRRRDWWRNRLVARGLAARPDLPSPLPRVIVATRQPGPPALVRVAGERAGMSMGGWIVGLGPGHAEGRVVVSAFERGSAHPSVVAKLARLPIPKGCVAAVASRPAEGAGFLGGRGATSHAGIDRAVPPIVARCRPRAFESVALAAGGAGTYTVDVETAATGYVLTDVLRGPFSTRRKRQAIQTVVRWLVEVAAATAHPQLGTSWAEDARVAARASGFDPPAGWVDLLASLPHVYEHGDLWSRNTLLGKDGHLTVVDWVDASPCGVPLRDLVWFLSDALAELDGARTQADRDAHFLALFTGRAPSSPLAFASLREVAAAAHVPSDVLGPLLSLGWAELAERRRREVAAVPDAIARTFTPGGVEPAVHRAELWLHDPVLRQGWAAWQ